MEAVFDEFENAAIPIINRYNGRLLCRIRPSTEAFIESAIDQPYEIHIVEFNSQQDFENFIKDETRKQFLHLKTKSIQSSILYKGERL
jgi:uncharacterized protein (DUF1330 family)